MLIRNAMNKTFQQSWMPHTTTEQPGVDKDSEHGRRRTERTKIERRPTMALWIKTCELQEEEDKSRNPREYL